MCIFLLSRFLKALTTTKSEQFGRLVTNKRIRENIRPPPPVYSNLAKLRVTFELFSTSYIVFNTLWVIFTADDRLIFFIFRLGLYYNELLLDSVI